MITKAEAVTLFTSFNLGFSQRVSALLRAAASAGQTSVTVSYGGVTDVVAAAVAAELSAAGWTVTNDAVGKTVVIS